MKKIISIVILFVLAGMLQAQSPDSLFAIAARNNPDLKAQFKAYEQAMEQVPQQGALPDPMLSFGYFISQPETRLGPQIAKVSLSQSIPWFGTLKARRNAAALNAEAQFQLFLDARNKLQYQVAKAYYPIYELQRKIDFEKENSEILKSFLKTARRMYQTGKGQMTDVIQVKMMLQESQTRMALLEKERKPLLAKLNKLLDRKPDAAVEVQESLPENKIPENYHRDSLFGNHPKLQAFDKQIEAAEEQITAARKKRYPNLGFGLDYTLVGERPNESLNDNGRDILMPMVTVSLPVFKSKNQATIEQAQLKNQEMQLRKASTKNTLAQQFEDIWFEIEKQKEFARLYDTQIEDAQQTVRLLMQSYSDGNTAFEEVLRMRQKVLKYQEQKVASEAALHIALNRLNYLTAKDPENE
ncbi:MAG: TolC family protein [Bacteroidota bacterium]